MILTIGSFQLRIYDYAGNRVSQGSLNLANILAENSSHKFVPDAFGTGSLSQKVDRVSGASENFSYRADQKLVSYSKDGLVAEYFYDALGRRVAKKITKGAEPAFTQSYVYLGEEDKILLGKSGDGEVTVYLDGQGIDEHLGEVSSRGVKAYATDHLGNVLNGEAAGAARAFGAWGENLNATAPAIAAISSPVVYGYTGRQLDPESQTYYYRARTYLPEAGRFLTKDPIGFDGGDVNLYRYVGNSPLNYTDPYGLCVPTPFGGCFPGPGFIGQGAGAFAGAAAAVGIGAGAAACGVLAAPMIVQAGTALAVWCASNPIVCQEIGIGIVGGGALSQGEQTGIPPTSLGEAIGTGIGYGIGQGLDFFK